MNIKPQLQASVPPEALHKWFSILVCVLHSVYFFLNMLLMQKIGLGAVQFIVAIFSGYCFYSTLKEHYKPWQSYMLMALLTFNILASASLMELWAGAFFWILALPLWYYNLFGLKKGFYFSIIIATLSVTILFLRIDTSLFMPYRTVFNFTLAYSSVWLMCHIYEVQRQKTSLFLRSLALQDALTGVKNRHALKADFSTVRKEAESLHMLIIDIDHFKNINDKFGHDIGDSVLIKAANVLRQSIQGLNIYRLGGEEFVALLKGVNDKQAYYQAEIIRKAVEQATFYSHTEEIALTVSIGISSLQAEQEFTDFLRAADVKLYQAKHEGRNQVRN
jgi:diguanylate cyclase (GGDEF)-like protein